MTSARVSVLKASLTLLCFHSICSLLSLYSLGDDRLLVWCWNTHFFFPHLASSVSDSGDLDRTL